MESSSKSRFLKVKCPRCANHQVIFGKSTTKVKCKKCNKLLVRSTGGKTKIKASVYEVF
ncbi:MAG: 30S ribosomal protein S27e [Nanoarchaeota archaeon]|nr:30S ribosomal protein S27e [Nanoarchaeota archaeon]